jgi:glycosyltransferase involved in cell wall biosynthesis
VIHVGSLQSAKNHERLLAIFRELRARVPDLYLLLVGRDEDTGVATRELVGRLGCAEHVLFLGERTDVAPLLRSADLMIFPSRREGLPGAVLEASAAGLPVLASDLPGIREISEVVPEIQFLPLAATDERWAEVAEGLLSGDRPQSLSRLRGSRFDMSSSVAAHARAWAVG